MRIVGGRFRGAKLATPEDAGIGEDGGEARLRPTTDRVRESLFNLLAHGDYGVPAPPHGRRVLDLFAGVGALGLEALSRGAARVQFVDDLPAARALIRRNIETLNVIGQCKVFRRDATRLGACRGEPYDLVFLDPPYGRGLGEAALDAALVGGWCAPGALAVWEEDASAPVALPLGASLLDERRYGATAIRILRLP
ncbi:MAG: 16S rRNA (guanine(966)-N(2))-methyltransferase RsmD [Pseudomonadota bacterium]|nr:16S rRNA (guanine(966)-N(2))-methyltransferase RsmD [Pseudomonadota bacterium]MEE3100933.1 16S rRNA (guanine(966)-N(2))-methyltransferase RsmD [Pseudomonadota bacterium]